MQYTNDTLEQLLLQHVNHKDIPALREMFEEYNIVDLADIFGQLSIQQAVFVFRVLPKDSAAELFTYLDIPHQQRLVEVLSSQDVYDIIDNMFSDDIVDFLEEMPANVIRKILSSVSPQHRIEINHLLSYAEDSAGSMMSIDFMELQSMETVESAIERIKQQADLVETINVCYVVNTVREYIGVVHLRDIIVAHNDTLIGELVEESDIFVYTHTDQETVAQTIQKYDITAVPVLNDQERLIGIVTADDVLDILIEEGSEDIHKMSGVGSTKGSYIETSVKEIIQSRIYWLLFLMISASFTGQILQQFEDKLSAVAALAVSIPMIMSTAGNAGSQSSATIIRSIAIDDLTFKQHVITVMKKEFLVSLLCGGIVFVVNMIRLMILPTIGRDITVAFVVSLTLVLSIIIANVIGGLLPLMAKSLKLDPASMAAPVITTLVDAASLIIYFTMATYFLNLV
ncbi:magnesium transporter [Carnobacteriaceae bacterium zg-ZUI252]|nr:magnesium transporter [Carnobacteriaceae bacterium zg-ZUI252]MBS4770224.1 magnesium transporter [Carnobacteriaceae bacterium zg-ZUI240]QTU83418.1 magnesium transporter [Carnobacteriaceae bacterium zg-C25]